MDMKKMNLKTSGCDMKNKELEILVIDRIKELNIEMIRLESLPSMGKTINASIRRIKEAIAHNEWILNGQPTNLN